jgi:hypothetical protein
LRKILYSPKIHTMNKALYIVGIVFSFVFFCVSAYYVEEVSSARIMDIFSNYDSFGGYSSYSSYNSYSTSASDLTTEAGLIALFFLLVVIFVDIMGMLKVKTKTSKVFTIIGLALGGIFLLWDIVMLTSPDSISYDEAGVGFTFYALIVLAFSIVGLVQSIRFGKQKTGVKNPSNDLLDS